MNKQIRIAVMAPVNPVEYFDLIWNGIWSAACDLAPLGVVVESLQTQGPDVLAQERMLDGLLASPPEALAIVPASSSRLDSSLERLSRAGVRVVTFNADAPASGRATYVGAHPEESGALAAELLAKMMHGRGTLVSFPGTFETLHLSLRYTAFRNELQRRAPAIQESICHSGPAGLEEAAMKIFRSGGPIGGVYAGSAPVHVVARAMETCGVGVPCVGFGNTRATQPHIALGTVSAVVDDLPYKQGYLALHHAYQAIHRGPDCKTSWVKLPSKAVFTTNASQPEEEGADEGMEMLVRLRTQEAASSQSAVREAEARIQSILDTDPLTGLANRARFEDILTIRAREKQRLSLLLIGLESISTSVPLINDEAVTRLAGVLSTHSRVQDCCARLAAHEFAVLMPGAGYAEAAERKNLILKALENTVIAPRTLNLDLRAAIGIASMPEGASGPEDLLIMADRALFAQRRHSSASAALKLRLWNSGVNASSKPS